jgi:hypothetical protein
MLKNLLSRHKSTQEVEERVHLTMDLKEEYIYAKRRILCFLQIKFNIIERPKEARDLAEKMLGHSLVTKQTPPEGVLVQKVN